MRLIDADAFKEYMRKALEETRGYYSDKGEWAEAITEQFCKDIDDQPTIEPERKNGKWILHPEIKNVYGGTVIECSECGEKYVVQHLEDEKYCRNCGAKMEVET